MIRFTILLLLLAWPAAADGLKLLSDYNWSIRDRRFGGFSALHVSDGGTRLLAMSDRGLFATGTVRRDGDRITGIGDVGFAPVRQIDGKPVQGYVSDSEGLAVDRRGNIYVSFEGFHRIRQYDAITANAQHIPGPPEFQLLQGNSGLEALAVDPHGTLYAVPERSGKLTRPFPVFRYRAGRWDTRLSIPRRGNYLPTGADIGPDGKFYLLERSHNGLLGFGARIRRFTLGADRLSGEEVLFESRDRSLDNMEGISTWLDAEGRIRVTLISDDNFFPLQQTRIVEFAVTRGDS